MVPFRQHHPAASRLQQAHQRLKTPLTACQSACTHQPTQHTKTQTNPHRTWNPEPKAVHCKQPQSNSHSFSMQAVLCSTVINSHAKARQQHQKGTSHASLTPNLSPPAWAVRQSLGLSINPNPRDQSATGMAVLHLVCTKQRVCKISPSHPSSLSRTDLHLQPLLITQSLSHHIPMTLTAKRMAVQMAQVQKQWL